MSILSKRRRYTQVTPEEVYELYVDGYNFSQIAQELNCCRNTVRKKIREYAVETGARIYISGKPCQNEFTVDFIIDLYDEGWTVKEIAEESGFTLSYIYKVLKKYRG